MAISPEYFACFRWNFQNWKEQSFNVTIGTEGIIQLLKGYFHNKTKTINSQNVPSEALVNNFSVW